MKNFIYLITAALLVSCGGEEAPKPEPVDPNLVKIGGTITNPVDGMVYIELEDNTVDSAAVDAKGNFAIELSVKKAMSASFHHGHEMSAMLLAPGFDLNVTLDPNMFDETIKYAGKGSGPNNFLAQSYLMEEKAAENKDALYGKSLTEFNNEIDQAKNNQLTQLDQSFQDISGFESLAQEKKKEIEYNWAYQKLSYPDQHYFATKEAVTLDSTYYSFVNDFDLNNEADLVINNYKLFLLAVANKRASDYVAKDENIKDLKLYAYVKENHTGAVKEKLLNYVVQGAVYDMPYEPNTEKVLADFATVNPEVHAKLKGMYDSFQALKPGTVAPDFKFPSLAGDSIALSDYKGKFVYVDVWATWCNPCLAEIPFLKELVQSFEGNDQIVFMQVSVDEAKDKSKWEEMVKEENINAVQLFADGWNNELCKAYAINGIPRFILVGPDGKIIDAFASRPSANAKSLIELKLKSI